MNSYLLDEYLYMAQLAPTYLASFDFIKINIGTAFSQFY